MKKSYTYLAILLSLILAVTLFLWMKKNNQLPYRNYDVTYLNRESGLELAGTLTIPHTKLPCPAIILVAGTGRHERNCTMKGHQLFTAIADFLARKGIATLRYDKRGVEKSQGTFTTNLTSQDFASDLQAGLTYLKTRTEVNASMIGLLGHSEGGLIVCMVAAASNDVKFLILMGGAASTDIDGIVEQACLQLKADGASEELIALDRKIRTQILSIVHQESDHDDADKLLHTAIENYLKSLTKAQTQEAESLVFESYKTYFEPQAPVYAISRLNSQYMIQVFNSPWIRFLLAYDAPATLQKITVPTAIINGQFDFIVAKDVTVPVFEQNLIHCPHQIIEIPKVNHWFETCTTDQSVNMVQQKKLSRHYF